MQDEFYRDPYMKVISIINNKGGVGKTTSTINIAGALAQSRAQVLVVDLDMQASSSLAMGIRREYLENNPTSANVLFGECAPSKAIVNLESIEKGGPGFDIMPGSLNLASADLQLSGTHQRSFRLRKILATLRSSYHVILLDCPPSTQLVGVNAVIASDAILIPLAPTYLGLEGIAGFGKVLDKVEDNLNEVPPVIGILVTLVDKSKSTERVVERIRNHYTDNVLKTQIGRHPELKESFKFSQTIFQYAPESEGAREYTALTSEMRGRIINYNENAERRIAAEKEKAQRQAPQQQPPQRQIEGPNKEARPSNADPEQARTPSQEPSRSNTPQQPQRRATHRPEEQEDLDGFVDEIIEAPENRAGEGEAVQEEGDAAPVQWPEDMR